MRRPRRTEKREQLRCFARAICQSAIQRLVSVGYLHGVHAVGVSRPAYQPMGLVDLRARNIDTLEQIERSSVDVYASERSPYRQYRNSEIRNGKQGLSDLPDL